MLNFRAISFATVFFAAALAGAAPGAAPPSPVQSEWQQTGTGEAAATPGTGAALPGAQDRQKSGGSRDAAQPMVAGKTVVRVIIFFVFVLAGGLLARVVIRKAKYLSMTGLNKMRARKFTSLSPMVTRSLEQMGSSLWGRNNLWSSNYRITHRSGRWILCDRKREQLFRRLSENNCLEVCLRDTNFKLKIVLLHGERSSIVIESTGTSLNELNARLEEARVLLAGQN